MIAMEPSEGKRANYKGSEYNLPISNIILNAITVHPVGLK